jgi:hypothetical protein
MPAGGHRVSGFGEEGGIEVMNRDTQPKTHAVNFGGSSEPARA